MFLSRREEVSASQEDTLFVCEVAASALRLRLLWLSLKLISNLIKQRYVSDLW